MKATLLASYRRRERSGYRDYSLKLDGSTILHLLHELVGGIPTPLKNMSSSVGMMTFPIYGKITNVPNHQPDMVL